MFSHSYISNSTSLVWMISLSHSCLTCICSFSIVSKTELILLCKQVTWVFFFLIYTVESFCTFRFLSFFQLCWLVSCVFSNYSFLVIIMPWIILIVDYFLVKSVVAVAWKPVVIDLFKDGYQWNQFSSFHRLRQYKCGKYECCWRWLEHTLHQLRLVPCKQQAFMFTE